MEVPAHLWVMAGALKDLKVWQESVALAVDVVRALRPHVRRETKAVSDLVMVTAATAASRIAEGYHEYATSEQHDLYRSARRDLARLETQLAIARQADLLEAAPYAALTQRIHSVSRLLGGYLVYLERQLSSGDQEIKTSGAASR
jgi:four helix bundle protein